MRASTYPLVDADEAAAIVLDRTPGLGVEGVTLAEGAGRVLAEDLIAPSALPAFPSSAVDGYAVRSSDAGRTLLVIGESAAGRPFAGPVAPGTAARVLTGGVGPHSPFGTAISEGGQHDRGGGTTVLPHLRPANKPTPGGAQQPGRAALLAGSP